MGSQEPGYLTGTHWSYDDTARIGEGCNCHWDFSTGHYPMHYGRRCACMCLIHRDNAPEQPPSTPRGSL